MPTTNPEKMSSYINSHDHYNSIYWSLESLNKGYTPTTITWYKLQELYPKTSLENVLTLVALEVFKIQCLSVYFEHQYEDDDIKAEYRALEKMEEIESYIKANNHSALLFEPIALLKLMTSTKEQILYHVLQLKLKDYDFKRASKVIDVWESLCKDIALNIVENLPEYEACKYSH